MLQNAIDPVGCLLGLMVLERARTLFPSWVLGRNVECCSHISPIHVVGHVVAEDDFVLWGFEVFGPRCVLGFGVATSVRLNFAVDN